MMDQEEPDRRQFFRIRTLARIGLRVLAPDELEGARLRVAARTQPSRFVLVAGDELRPAAESYATLQLLQQILFALDRLNRRMDELLAQSQGGARAMVAETLSVSLSGSGFAASFASELRRGELVEAEIELGESGLPVLACIARVVSAEPAGKRTLAALHFDALAPEDRERIVQFCIQSQSRELAARRPGSRA
jgi:hypothetical protein